MSEALERLKAYKPLLVIHVVWHPQFSGGRKMAERIYALFNRDPEKPNARGLGIPVFFRSETASGDAIPRPIQLGAAQHTVVIALVDTKMVIAGQDWHAYLGTLWHDAMAAPDRHRFFPVALTPNAYTILSEANHIRLQDLSAEAVPGVLLNRLTNELGRLLTRRPTLARVETEGAPRAAVPKMRLFLSHAKLDGEKPTRALRDYIHDNLALETFFDAIDIAAGLRFVDQIDEGIDAAAFALVHTDAYASRVWCQHEVIRAKRHGRPVVVIHAIEEGEARSFPYLGNVPTIRWHDDAARLEAIVGLILLEVLRTEYFVRHFENIRTLFHVPPSVRALARAPELLTALALRSQADSVPFFVYPDPPLAKQEIDLLLELAPGLRLTTPTLLFANPARQGEIDGAAARKALCGWRVGISISESEQLAQRGMGFPRLPGEKTAPASPHLRDAMVEFARFFLSAGAALSYGGDLRKGGFTFVLFELLAAYRAMSGEDSAPVESWLSWPLHRDLTEKQEADWVGLVRFHKVPPAPSLGVDPAAKTPPTTPENRVAWARSLTAMREQMNLETDARLFLGGQLGSLGERGFGRYPGLAEEALLALRAKKPVYLIGAFGGCTEAIIEALHGRSPPAFTDAERLADRGVAAACEQYNASLSPGAERIDYASLTAEFERIGCAGLNNGLNPHENELLFTTTHLPEMIAVVLRGLGRLISSAPRSS